MAFDPIGALQTLLRFGVRFVIIGGIRVGSGGWPTMTNNVDICYDRDPANLQRLAAALTELQGRLRGVDDDAPFLLDAATLATGKNFTFITDLGRLDVLGLPAGVKDFHALAVNAATFDLADGVIVQVCELDDLIRMKRAAGRPKDRIELEILTAVRECWLVVEQVTRSARVMAPMNRSGVGERTRW